MKKIKLLLLIPFLSAFTKAVTPKAVSPLLATGGIFLSFLESKSQTPLTKEMADTMYKPINYIPTMQTFGFNVGFDNSGIYYPAARPDYRFDIDVLPILGAVAYSSLYNDLIFRPDLNHLPNYYEIGYCDTAFLWKKDMGYGLKMVLNKIITDTASTNGIMSKDRANAAITAINNNISNKLDKTETITINGTSRTYSSNPVFSIPTVTNTNQLVNGSNYLTSEVDGSITNEIQLLSGSGTKTITLSNSGGNFVIPNVTSTEINTALGGVPITTLTANQIYTALTYTPLSNTYTPIDNSITNEIQTLSGSGTNTISLSSGGTFVLPSTVSQTLSVNGSSLTISSGNTVNLKKSIPYSVTTNSLGIATGTFATAYSVAPNIQANIVGGTANQVVTMAVTTTGFTCTVVQRNSVTLLAVEVLLAATVPVNGASIDVLITEK